MSDELTRVLSLIDQEFWTGLTAFVEHRRDILRHEAIAAKDWDAVQRAKGADAEILGLLKLRKDFEAYAQARAIAK